VSARRNDPVIRRKRAANEDTAHKRPSQPTNQPPRWFRLWADGVPLAVALRGGEPAPIAEDTPPEGDAAAYTVDGDSRLCNMCHSRFSVAWAQHKRSERHKAARLATPSPLP